MDVDLKPIIYLYPEKTTEISVKLGKAENITCSYPKYSNGWNVIANTDGTLIDINTGRKLTTYDLLQQMKLIKICH